MTSLHVCFSKHPVKSQPEVGLSQDFLDFGQLDHDLTGLSASIPIPPNAIPLNTAANDRPELDTFDLTYFGSFSSAAESLVHDHAIVIPAYSPPSTPLTTATQDFCLWDEQQEFARAAPSSPFDFELQPQDTPSALLSSSSVCDQDCATPLISSTLSPYGFYMDDRMTMPSPSSPSAWLVNSMQTGLYIQSPSSSSLMPCEDSFTGTDLMDQLHPPQQQPQHQEQSVYYASSYSSSTISPITALTPSPQSQHYDAAATSSMDWPLQQNTTTHLPMVTTTAKDDDGWTPLYPKNNNGTAEAPNDSAFIFQHEIKTSDKKQNQQRQQGRRREYQCPHCRRKSNRSNNMKEHILTHDPNRPKNFPCTLCPKRFARKHDLKRHHQSHERNIEKMMVACGLVPGAAAFSST